MSGWASHLVLGSTGLALTVLATALVLRAWRRLPVPSYRLAVAVLAAALALPAAQLAARSLGLPLAHPVRSLVAALERDPVPPAATPVDATLPAYDRGPAIVEPSAGPSQGVRIDPALLALALLGQEAEEELGLTTAATAGPPPGAAGRGLSWRAILALVYACGAAVALMRTVRRLLRTRALLRSARPVDDPRVREVWREVSAGSPLVRRVRLLASDEVRAPACFGLGRPAIVLPEGTDLARHRDVLACILTHELVHLERRDGWVLLGEELLRAAFWFHPAAWWLVAQLERLREVSCDLLVVRRTGQRKRYAQALVEYAAWMTAGERILGGRAGQAAAVVPWSGSKGQLTRRIEMLLSNQAPSVGRGRYVAPAAVGLVFTFLWSGQLALAAGSPQDASPAQHAHGVHEVHDPLLAGHDSGQHLEAQGGIVVNTSGKDGQTVLHADSLELKSGQAIGVTPDGKQMHVFTLAEPAKQDDAPIGIVLGEADETLAAQMGEKLGHVIVVRRVLPGSRADKAGLEAHDVIVRVQGQGGSREQLLDRARLRLRDGKNVEVVVVRKGVRKPIELRARDGQQASVKAGPQEHDVIVSVDGRGGSKRDLIDHAKQALREGRDVEVVVVRKGDREPLLLRSEGGASTGVWLEKSDGAAAKKGDVRFFESGAPVKRKATIEVQADDQGRYRVFGLGGDREDDEEYEVVVEELNDVIGLGGGAGGAFGQGGKNVWKSEDGKVFTFGGLGEEGEVRVEAHVEVLPKAGFTYGRLGDDGEVHVETHVELSPEGGHGAKSHVFGLDSKGQVHEMSDFTFEGEGANEFTFRGGDTKDGEDEVIDDGEGHVTVLGGGGTFVTRGERGQHVTEFRLGDDVHGSDDLGRAMREHVEQYYSTVDPQEFQDHLNQALKAYEASRGDLSDEDAQKVLKLRYFAEKDAEEALKQARITLKGLSNRELGERTGKALKDVDVLREYTTQRRAKDYTDQLRAEEDFREAVRSTGMETERKKLEVLKSELDATRKKLELQQRQIEELRAKLEQLSLESGRGRQLR